MERSKQFGETYRKSVQGEKLKEVCELCGEELDIDPESGERYCPSCDNPEP